MSKCTAGITLLLIGILLICSRSDARPNHGGPPPANPEDEVIDYEDVPPTQFGERFYGLVVDFINGYVTGLQDVLDTSIKPFMYIVEKVTDQLNQ